MSFSFIQKFMLWGLLAALIPVIIHLLNRRRFRTVQWGAMQFLLQATRESRGKKRLKHILILTMRALAVAALIFAIARPLIGGLGWGGGRVETVILVLDRSNSMERMEAGAQLSKRESVIQRVATAMQDIGEARLVLIDSATGEAQEIDTPEVLPDLSVTQPTDTAADLPALLNTALDYLQEAQPGRSEIWIASDMQKGDWSPDDSRWDAFRATLDDLEVDVGLRVLALNARQGNDFGIRVISARRDAGELVLNLEVTREEDAGAVSKPVTVSHLGTRTASVVEMQGQAVRFQKRIPLEGKEGGHGWVSLPDQSNQRNNVAYYAYGPESPTFAYLVAESSTSSEALAAIETAIAPGFARQELTTVLPERAHQIDFDKASLVVWKAPMPTSPTSQQLLDFVRSGGVCLFLPPDQDTETSFGGLGWDPVTESPQGKVFLVKEWQHGDGPMRDGLDGTPVPAQRIRAIKRRGINGDTTVLAEWDDGQPFLVRRIVEAGTLYFLSTLPDYTWSNLEETAIHLVITQRAFEQGSQRLGSGFFGTAGKESALPQGDEIRARIDSSAEFAKSNSDFEAGVYRLGERIVAVNRPVEEDGFEFLSNPELDVILADTNYTLLEEEETTKGPLFRQAWRAFLIAMLLFLIAEAILCLQPRRPTSATAPSPQPAS